MTVDNVPRRPLATAPLSVLLLAERAPTAEETEVLAAWNEHLLGLQRPFELLLIRPRGSDDADAVAAAPRLFTYDAARGYVAALREAIAAAQLDVVVLCTWDRQFRPTELGNLLACLDPVDAVIGYRTGRPVPLWRRLVDRALSVGTRILLGSPLEPRRVWYGRHGWHRRWVARWIFGLRLADPECPFRVVRREVLTRIPLQSRGPFVQVEMLAKANHMECLLAEAPVSWSPPGEIAPLAYYVDDAKALFRRPDFGRAPGEIQPAP
jgi:hypothetical protein